MARGGWTGFLSLRDNGAATSLGTLGSSFKSVTDNFKKGFYQNFNLFTLMKKGIDAVVKSAQELIKESREIVTTSAKFNIPISQLGELRYVSLQSGLGVNGLTSALMTLKNAFLEGVINPGSEATWMMAKLGIKQSELLDLSQRTGVGFWRIVDSIRAMSNVTERDIALKAIYGAEWENVRIIVQKSAEEIRKLKDESHAYDTESSKDMENTSKSWDRTGERLKTMGSALAPIMGILAGLVEFISNVVIGVFIALGYVIQNIGLIGKKVFNDLAMNASIVGQQLWNVIKSMTPGSGYTMKEADADNDKLEKRRIELDKMLTKSNKESQAKIDADFDMNIARTGDGVRGGLNTIYESGVQIGINAGWRKNRLDTATEGEVKDNRNLGIVRQNQVTLKENIAAAEEEYDIMEAAGADAEVLKEYKKRNIEQAQKDLKEQYEKEEELLNSKKERLEKIKTFYKDAVFEDNKFKAKTDKPPEQPKLKTKTQVEIELAQNKAVRDQEIKAFAANVDSWDRWKSAVKQAEMEVEKAKQDIWEFIEAGFWEDVSKRNALLNAEKNAEIALQDKKRELSNLKDKTANDARLATINRKNQAIEEQQGRDLFGMKMRGVSAINQQNVVFRNSVDKLKREQAKLQDLATDKKREREYLGGKGEAAQTLEASIQGLMFEAAKEMDTLMAMQFNYVSSDAAKKGMGGGISMVNNPIDIAKESRDYLRKIYESMEGTGSFNVVPKYSPDGNPRGPMGSSLWGEAPSSQ